MQQAIPYKPWASLHASPVISHTAVLTKGTSKLDMIHMVSQNAVIVFARKGCCMSHVVRRLLLALGVNPAIYEIDEEDEAGVSDQLQMICGSSTGIHGNVDNNKKVQFPAVFIGGKLFGGLDRIMAAHISGDLVPVLKQAGALWL